MNPDTHTQSVRWRRLAFAGLNALLVAAGTLLMRSNLAKNGWSILGVCAFLLFVVLLAQLVYGFTVAVIGWVVLWRGGPALGIYQPSEEFILPETLSATAIVMPICNEEIERIFRGLQIMYESLEKTGRQADFDFFILSDTSDPNRWIAEERAWFELCQRVNGFGRIFYRKRRIGFHHKSGNIADFCRRWGGKYRYMLVLDADSIMTGRSFVRLTALMDQNPRIGIIQTCPQLVLGQTLFQRIAQFAQRVYGPMFSAGANFWQLDSGNFWGHNAIIRLKPFMRHCAMPELPKAGPLGRQILSHDTIEAAFMRRSGYAVWVAHDLGDSYEEGPPDLLASLQRDRRWCHGNLQHLWVLFARGIKPISRFHIFNGIMSYGSSAFWFLFLVVGIFLVPKHATEAMTYGNILYGGVVCMLLAPKILGALLILRQRDQLKLFGGAHRLIIGVLGETLFSILSAPILMLCYTRFVWASFSGAEVKWGGQRRGSDGLTWGQLISACLGISIFALLWGAFIQWYAPSLLLWFAPILIGPICLIPMAKMTGSLKLGMLSRRTRWFLIPEETNPPVELQEVEEPFTLAPNSFFQSKDYAGDYGLLQAILDPYINSIHVSLLRQRPQVSLRTRFFLNTLSDRLLLEGPFILNPREKRILLWDADSMQLLHHKLWSSPASHLHEWWQAAFRRYNETSALTVRRTVTVS